MDKFFQNIAVQWAGRRALEVGGLVGTLFVFYTNLPPLTQAALGKVFTNEWQDITLGSLVPVAAAAWGYIWSFRSTVKPHIVTDDGQKVASKDLPKNKRVYVDEAAKVAAEKKKAERKPNLLDKLFGR
jgi:hypothetical protein